MTKTKTDIIIKAHRDLGLVSVHDVPDGNATVYAEEQIDTLFEEIKDVHGFTFTWTLDATPEEYFTPLAMLLAAHLAPHYQVPGPSRSRAIMRMRALAFTDDRDDPRDLDDSGTIDSDEEDAGRRMRFY